MRQSGPFEYLDLEEVVKWDYGSEVPGEDGCGGIPDTMGVRRKRRRGKVPEREGVWVQMAAGEGSGTRGCPGANGGRGRLRNVRVAGCKWWWGRLRNAMVSECKWRWGKAPEREGGRVQMAAGKAPEREDVRVQMAAGEGSET